MEENAGPLRSYQIDATVDPDASTIAGTMHATYVNTAPVALDDIYFRLYPNASYYGDGDLTISAASVRGEPVEAVLEVEDTALRVPLPSPVAPAAIVEVTLAFVTTVPIDSTGSYGIFNRDTGSGTWILADWHPVLAVYEAANGWRIDPPTKFGDPTYAASSYFDVNLTVPVDLEVIASGSTIKEQGADQGVMRHIVAGPAREFTIVLDDNAVVVEGTVGGTTIRSWSEPEETLAGQAALDIAMQSLPVYGEWYGDYPFVELDLVQTPLSQALAVSWAGIIFLDGPTLAAQYAKNAPEAFETVVAHEVAHLWWGGTIGTDSNDHGFMNEGLATFSSIEYQAATGGDDDRAASLQTWVLEPSLALLQQGDTIVDQPARDHLDPAVRSWAVYGKATLGYLAIRETIGNAPFDAGLRAYAESFAFGIATPDDLQAAWETASGQNLDELWGHWFDAAEMTASEIEG